MGAGLVRLDCTAPPVPTGPAAALMFPPTVTLPPKEKALTASSEFSTTTKSVMSAPIWRPQPTPAVPMQEGADQEPSGSLAMTRPEPALPEKTNPALRTWKIASPVVDVESQLPLSAHYIFAKERCTSRALQDSFGNRIKC
jgi:hypothetical protein